MSATHLLIDGAARAATLVPLLFAPLLAPAAARAADAPVTLPRVVISAPSTAAAPVLLETVAERAPLTLAASHLDLRVVGTQARLRTTTLWRNDGPLPLAARWTQGRVVDPAATLGALEIDGCGESVDAMLARVEATLDDESIEAGEFTRADGGERVLAPGESIAVEVEQPADVLVRGDRRRLVLPLPTQRFGAFTPQFTASVTVDAEQPVVEIASATHAGELLRLSDSQVQWVVPPGRAYEGQFFALEFTLGALAPPSTAQVAGPQLAWGGEQRSRR